MEDRKCDLCDMELLINYPYDVCEKCCNDLKEAIKLPPIGFINSAGEIVKDN